jgi:hypothetical protein
MPKMSFKTVLEQLPRVETEWIRPLDPGSYRLTGFVLLRLLGLVYTLAFLSLSNQLGPLIGSDGLLPASLFLAKTARYFGDSATAWARMPTLFWFDASDATLQALCHLGLLLSVLLLFGIANIFQLIALWGIYLSFNQVGQLFYGYGWEIMLLESGFLAIFLAPLGSRQAPSPAALMWLYRWVLFRVIFGAGLIKVRGDACWLDLTCMFYHYQTQPIPNPLSWYFHQLPPLIHKLSVASTHFVELVVPFFIFAPRRRLRHLAGLLLIAFQLLLILSGNLSWLNYLTIALCIPCFDDAALQRVLPRRLADYIQRDPPPDIGHARRLALYALCTLVFYLSSAPIQNMVSPQQAMNRSYDPLHLVNTYGAFGHIGKTRYEIVLKGTNDHPADPQARWQEYQFNAKPGDINRRPALISPYHYRIDWQIWFAAMSDYKSNPWLVHFIYKLLQGNEGAISLLEYNPFAEKPPTYIQADLYEYEFTSVGDDTDAWWNRKRLGTWLGPLSTLDPALIDFLQHYGWHP